MPITASSIELCRVFLSTATARDSLGPFDNEDDTQREILPMLTRTAVHKMRISQLRDELSRRGIDTDGKKPDLVKRLLNSLDHENNSGIVKDTLTIPLMAEEKEQSTPLQQQDAPIISTTTRGPLDPAFKYVIQIRSAPSGSMRIVEGVGIGMTLLVMDHVDDDEEEDSSNSPPPKLFFLESNQLLLPGSRSPFEADYCALIMAAQEAQRRGIQKVRMEIEDIGIVRQLTGQGRVGPGHYQQELYGQAMALKDSFQEFEICVHQPGTKKEAETQRLARTALAKQKHLELDNWDMVDPMTDQRATSSSDIVIDPQKDYLLRFDGGARGNPSGIGGAGMVIYDGDKEVWCGWKYLGRDITNNVAEYNSLLEGLQCAKALGIRRLRAEGDSELIVKQVLGKYQVKKDWLKPLHREVLKLIACFDAFNIKYIPRADNKRADFLANHAMDDQSSDLEKPLL